MIYLFTNEGYGAPFQRAVRDLPRRRRRAFTLVWTRRRRPLGRRSRFRALISGWSRAARLRALGVKVIHVANVNDAGFLASVHPGGHAVVAGFNQIFQQPAIDRFASIVNIHPSVLPLYRGPVPSYWCLRHRESRSGFTLHRISTAIDAGEVLHQEVVPVARDDTPADLDRRIAEAAVPTFLRWIDHLDLDEPWTGSTIDAHEVYGVHMEYGSFPPSS